MGCEEKTQLDWEGGLCLRRGFLWEKADQVLWVAGPEVTSIQRGPRGPVGKMEPLPGMSMEGIEYKELFPEVVEWLEGQTGESWQPRDEQLQEAIVFYPKLDDTGSRGIVRAQKPGLPDWSRREVQPLPEKLPGQPERARSTPASPLLLPSSLPLAPPPV